MPPAPHRSDTRPAEEILEDLLRAWPPSAEARGKSTPKRRPFATAFLPPASHLAPRLPVFRLKTPPMARVDLRPMRQRADLGPKPGASRVPTPSFQSVADAIAARGAGSARGSAAAMARTAEPAADEPADLTSSAPECSEDYRFAAQVVALKAAGVLDPPAASGGGSPAPSNYADHYAGNAVAGSARPTQDTATGHPPVPAAILVPDPGVADVDRAGPREDDPSSPFSADDDIMLPRSIFL